MCEATEPEWLAGRWHMAKEQLSKNIEQITDISVAMQQVVDTGW
jgi:hypothetical protein